MLRNKYYLYGKSVGVPSHLHFGQELLERMIEHKDVVALINADTDERLTYGELAQNTVDIALSLTRIGVGKGDVISICSEKRFEVMSTVLGVFCAGATFSPTDITYGTVPLLHRVKIAKPKIMFCSPAAYQTHRAAFDSVGCVQHYIVYPDQSDTKDPSSLDQSKSLHHGSFSKDQSTDGSHKDASKKPKTSEWSFKDFLSETAGIDDFVSAPVDGWKDRALILFSSGTTGLPKGVPHTHLGLLINSYSIAVESYKEECVLNTREWYYTYGLLHSLACMCRGATLVYSFRNTHADCLAAIQRYKIKHLQLTPALVSKLIKSPVLADYDLSSVEAIISSSTAIMAEQVNAVKRRLPSLKNVYQIYGTSEAGGVCTELWAPQGPRGGSAGTPSHSFIMKVVDLETRQPVGPGVRGEICFKSPCLTPDSCLNVKGYLDVPHRDYMDSEGFYKSGDVGYYDEDNYFYIVNRVKELIKYNDISIAPSELESILLQHPSVRDVGVVGAPSKEVGEAPTAFVVLQPECQVEGDELKDFLETRITFRMRLAGGVRFVDKLPRGAGEKLDRNALKAMLLPELSRD